MHATSPILSVEFACPLPSRGNLEKHWRVRATLVTKQRDATMAALKVGSAGLRSMPTPPLTVVLTRVSGGRIDSDNLSTALKGPRDAVAYWLGVDDGDPAVTWQVRAERRTGLPMLTKRNGKRERTQRLRVQVFAGISRCETCGHVVVPGEVVAA